MPDDETKLADARTKSLGHDVEGVTVEARRRKGAKYAGAKTRLVATRKANYLLYMFVEFELTSKYKCYSVNQCIYCSYHQLRQFHH